MSLYTESFEGSGSPPSGAEIQELMVEKAHELFRVCDTEEKGFITKRDMQRLQSELPLSPEQLEAVFDSLDDDGNGFLTLEEFTDGFGSFLGMKGSTDPGSESHGEQDMYTDDHTDPAEDELNFAQMMNNLGAKELFEDEATIKGLWTRLRHEDQDTAGHFEDFLYKISNEIRKSKTEFDTLEGALRSKSSAHDEEVRKLYEEMEHQIKLEKEKILSEERVKERQMREAMEQDLTEKDRQLQELMNKHAEMEERMRSLNAMETETKQENDKLAKEKEMLEESLIRSQENLEESNSYINQLRQQQKDEKRERARAALKLSEGIALERESLVKQLDTLRNVNKKLRDDKDEADTRRDVPFADIAEDQILEASPRREVSRKDLERQGSVLSNYFPSSRIPKLSATTQSISEDVDGKHLDNLDDGIECDDDVYIDGTPPKFIHHNNNVTTSSLHHHSNREVIRSPGKHHIKGSHDDGSGSENEYDLPEEVSRKLTRAGNYDSTSPPRVGQVAHTVYAATRLVKPKESSSSTIMDSPRAQPVGADEMTDSGNQSVTDGVTLRQRVFKVVFVGDSGVGKSSFIHRFCNDSFKSSYAATIGVDFQIKSLAIDGHLIVLQLWDTAGQERFRSITKQYFRKADGIIVMYDVTSETTFTSVRNWMTSAQEGAGEEAVPVLMGNKNDLPEEDSTKAVKMKDGSRLAVEFGALYYETSALTGENVQKAMEDLARTLKDKEDREIERSFQLEENKEKKGCCSR